MGIWKFGARPSVNFSYYWLFWALTWIFEIKIIEKICLGVFRFEIGPLLLKIRAAHSLIRINWSVETWGCPLPCYLWLLKKTWLKLVMLEKYSSLFQSPLAHIFLKLDIKNKTLFQLGLVPTRCQKKNKACTYLYFFKNWYSK